jgi:hypothetical protein
LRHKIAQCPRKIAQNVTQPIYCLIQCMTYSVFIFYEYKNIWPILLRI